MVLEPALETDITTLENQYDIKFPPDFRVYLLNACPKKSTSDVNMTEWWTTKRIKNIPNEIEGDVSIKDPTIDPAKCFFFADYLVWAWAWAVCCQPGSRYGSIVQVGSEKNCIIANNFSEFVDLYVQEVPDLF